MSPNGREAWGLRTWGVEWRQSPLVILPGTTPSPQANTQFHSPSIGPSAEEKGEGPGGLRGVGDSRVPDLQAFPPATPSS